MSEQKKLIFQYDDSMCECECEEVLILYPLIDTSS